MLADAHANRARELISRATDTDYDEPAKAAVEELRIAAGMFDYMAKVVIFNWKAAPVFEPFDCNPIIVASMRNLCMSMGQAIIVKKALLHGTSMPVVSKISVGGFRKAEEAFKAVIGMREEKCINEDFKGR